MGRAFETPAGSVWPLFLTAHAVLVERIEARLAGAGLPPLAWYDVLWALERAPERRLRMSELADHVVLSRSNLTRLVDRLEEAGLVARERSEEDRRGAYAVITTAGREVRRKMWPTYEAGIREVFDSQLGEAEARPMAAALQRMLDAARGVPSRAAPVKRAR
ncbi:MAG: MarR family transcriptional regulator [Burkholderiales bacterium]|nr:MarR family transcriptional regulator [Burkholderiales bacterium]